MTRTLPPLLMGTILCACTHAAPIVDRYVAYDVRSEINPVGDVEGHVAGSFAKHGVCLKNIGLPDEEAGLLTETGTLDAVYPSATTISKCDLAGKRTCTFADNSSHTDEWSATCKYGPSGKPVTEGRRTFVKGRGRFEGIKGTGTFTGILIGEAENLWVTTPITEEIALPKK